MQDRKKALKIVALFISQLVILLVMIISKQLVYATNDDTTIVSLASGAYGSPTEYIINMHYFIGCILKFLFRIMPTINWVTVLFISLLLWSFLLIDCMVVKVGILWDSIVAKGLIVDILFIMCTGYFSFTVVAYVAVMVGILAFLLNDSVKKNKGVLLQAFVLLVFGLMVRGEVAKSLVIVALPIIFLKSKDKINKKTIVVILTTVVLMFALEKTNFYLVNLNETQKNFLEWGETRSKALDCKAVPYNEEIFDKVGISAAQYNAIYNAFYYSYETIDLDVMQEIIALNSLQNKYNFDIMGFVENHFSFLQNVVSFDNMHKVIFYILIIFYFLLGNKRQRYFITFTWLMVLGTEWIFFFINRALYRVVMPNYVFAIVIMLLCCRIDKKYLDKLEVNRISKKKMVVTFGSILAIFAVYSKLAHCDYYQGWLYSNERQEVLAYMEENSEKIFLAGDARVFTIGVAESVWECPRQEKGWNLIGNWETYSLPYLELMESHNISDPYNVLLEAIDNEDILLLTSFGKDFPKNYSWILELVEETYGLEVEFKKVDTICTNKITEDIAEEYVTYRLVRRERDYGKEK